MNKTIENNTIMNIIDISDYELVCTDCPEKSQVKFNFAKLPW